MKKWKILKENENKRIDRNLEMGETNKTKSNRGKLAEYGQKIIKLKRKTRQDDVTKRTKISRRSPCSDITFSFRRCSCRLAAPAVEEDWRW